MLETKAKIAKVVSDGYEAQILNREEYEAMNPKEAHPGKFYATFKVHKPHKEGRAPPLRPIVSTSGSLTENIALYVEHQFNKGYRPISWSIFARYTRFPSTN